MASQQDLTLAVLFKAIEDGTFKRVVRRLTTLLTGLNTTLKQTSIASKQLDASSKRLSQSLNAVGKNASVTGKQIGKVTGGIERLASAFKVTASYFVSARLFYSLIQGAKAGIAEIVNFDQALYNLAAISGATAGEIEAMKDVILETADRTKYSTTEIAEGMVLLTQSGLDAGEAIQAIGAVADLAAGTLSNLATASDLVTTTLRAFNIDANNTRHIADVMANAINKSKLTVDKLRIAFNYVSTSAYQAGLSLEQTAGVMMMLANAGARASTIGTGTRQVLARLLSPNKKLREAMAMYGLEIEKASGKQEWFEEQIEKLSSVLYNHEKGMVDMSKAYELFGLRGAQAAAILVDNYMDLNGAWSRTMDQARKVGTAAEMMRKQSEGLAFKIKNLSDKLKNLAIVMGDAGFTKVLKIVVDLLRGLVFLLTEISDTTLGKFIVNLLLVITTWKTLIFLIKVTKTLLGSLSLKLAVFASPATWGVVAIGAAVAILMTWIGYVDKASIAGAKLATKNQALAKSLNYYKDILAEVEFGSDEYYNIIEQLKQAHPELAAEIDKVKDSYEKLNEVLKKNIEIGKEKALEGNIQQLEKIADVLSTARKNYEHLSFLVKRSGREAPDWEKYLEGLEGYYVGIGNIGKILDTTGPTITSFARRFREQGVAIEDVDTKLQELIANFGKNLKIDDTQLKYFIELIKKTMSDLDKYEKEGIAKTIKTRKQKLEQLLPEWKRIYDRLNGVEKAYFLQAIETTSNGWERIKNIIEHYKDVIYKGDEARYKRDLEAMKEAYRADKLKKYFDEQSKRLREVPDEWREAYSKATDEVKFKLAEAMASTQSAWNKELTWHEMNNRKKGESTEAFYARMAELRKKRFDEGLKDYEAQKVKEEDVIRKIEDRINKIHDRYVGNRYDSEFAKAKKTYNDINNLLEQQIAKGKDVDNLMLRNKEAYYNELERMARIYGFGAKHGREEYEAITGRKAPELAGVNTIEELSKRWKKSSKNIEEYRAQLQVLADEGKISTMEMQDALDRTFAAPGKAFVSGWSKAMDEIRSQSEFLYDLGEKLPEKLADGFVDAWELWVDGTKSAAEAFEDFARGVLKWIAQMILKQTIFNAMQGLLGGFGGAATPAAPVPAGAGIVAHSGGIVGRDRFLSTKHLSGLFASVAPRLHDGINNRLRADEYPAILQRDEGVFTKEQMRVLGASRGTSISVPINIADTENADILKRHLPKAIEDAVLRTMRKYVK